MKKNIIDMTYGEARAFLDIYLAKTLEGYTNISDDLKPCFKLGVCEGLLESILSGVYTKETLIDTMNRIIDKKD